MKRAVVVIAVAVAVGVGGLLWWQHRASPVAESEGTPTAGPAATPVERARGGEGGAPLAPLTDDDPKGTLRLEGIVLGDGDHPVAGAQIALDANPPRVTSSTEDGTFAFDALVGRAYTLVARAKSGVAGPVTVRLTDKSEPVVMHLRAGAKLTVTVVGPDAAPIGGATVEARGLDVQHSAADEHGIAAFPVVVPGPYELVAWAPGMAKTYQQVRVVGATTARIMLAPGARVSGRVVDDQRAPVAGARVGFAPAGDLRGGAADPRRDAATTGPDGAWAFDALPAGSFRFVASDLEHAPGMSALVTLDGAHETSGVAIELAPGAVVRGRVVDNAQRGVLGARVRIATGFRPGARVPPRQAYSDTTGAFELRGVPRGELFATAQHESGASSGAPVDTTRGDVGDVVLVIDHVLAIAGVVVDEAGEPIEGAQVTAQPRPGDAAFDPMASAFRTRAEPALTDAGGRFQIRGLAAGAYLVRATRGGAQATRPRGRRRSDGVAADAGSSDVRIVLPAEGGVKGRVLFADGTSPQMFVVGIGGTEQSFTGGGEFALGELAPGDYDLRVRGPLFDTKATPVTVEPGKVADAGTITVTPGRRLAGIVVANGQPVPGASVYAGRQVMGGGSSNAQVMGGDLSARMGAGSKTDTTAADGTFGLAGFGEGDLTIVAELPSLGRSKPLRVTEAAQNATQLVLDLQPYGSISGMLRGADAAGRGVAVVAQSVSTPGAQYVVAAGADGAYRFDRLAPDTYKVSATVRSRGGAKLYSKQADVPLGGNVVVDLAIDPGAVTVVATATGTDGVADGGVGWLATGELDAHTQAELSLKLAGAGAGTSTMSFLRDGVATFTEVAPGPHTVCIAPLPRGVHGQAAFAYVDAHASKLAAFCKPVDVQPSPDSQAATVLVTVPAPIP